MNTLPKKVIPIQDGEHVVFVVRKHWLPLAIEAMLYLFLTTVGIVLLASLVHVAMPYMYGHQLVALGVFVFVFISLLFWMKFFSSWSDYWLDVWIITNKRIIDIDQKGFFQREVSTIPLERIQDVTYSIDGILAMWLRFGNVRVQTASITDSLTLRQVQFPDLVKEKILLAQEEYKKYSTHA